MRKKWIFIALTLTAVIVVIVLGPKLYLKILEKKIDSIKIGQTRINKNSVEMNVMVEIQEKWIPVLIDSMAYRTEIYDTIISEGVTRLDPEKRSNKEVIFPVKVRNELLEENIKKHQGDSTEVKMYISQYVNLPLLGTRRIDVVKAIHMRIPVIPKVKIEDVKILDFGFDEMQMSVTLSVDNPNNIDFTIRHMKSSIQVKDYATSYSETDKDYHVKKHDVTLITVPVTTNLQNEVKAMWKTITGDTEWPYYMKSEMVLDPSDEQLNNIQSVSEKKGMVDVKKAIKAMRNKERVGIDENK